MSDPVFVIHHDYASVCKEVILIRYDVIVIMQWLKLCEQFSLLLGKSVIFVGSSSNAKQVETAMANTLPRCNGFILAHIMAYWVEL